MIDDNNLKRKIIGLGFDNEDGHTRITRGENFELYGGSQDTHEMMQEKAIKFNESLQKRNKTLDEINHDECREIADEIGLKMYHPDTNDERRS